MEYKTSILVFDFVGEEHRTGTSLQAEKSLNLELNEFIANGWELDSLSSDVSHRDGYGSKIYYTLVFKK